MMKRILEKISPSELGRGAIILFVTMSIYNFLNFLFHFAMGRFLVPADYGTLAVLMSLISIYGIPTEAIQNLISRYTSRLNLKKNHGKIKFLMVKSIRRGLSLSILVFIFATIISFFLSEALKINFWLIFMTNTIIFFSFSVPIVRGVLQGRKKFSFLGTSMIIESGLKLIFSISLVIFGLKVFGAMGGVLLGSCAGLIFALHFNKEIINEEKENTSFKEIYFESVPYFITMLAVFLVLSLDMILAKRFFSPELAGQYAVLSTLGKAIFLGTLSISKVMFPLVSESNDTKENPSHLFKKSIYIIIALCIAVVLVYAFFPKGVITILYGSKYIEMYPYLIYSGITFSLLSITNLILLYRLSTNKLYRTYLLFLFLIIEIVLFFLYHDNISEYILAFMVSNIIMFIGSVFFIKK